MIVSPSHLNSKSPHNKVARDLQNFSFVRNAAAVVTIPQYTVSGTVVDSDTGAVIRNFSVDFWTQFNTLSVARQDSIIERIIFDILAAKGVTA